jgi:hypothetical protein
MPLAKIHVHEGRYDEAGLSKLGNAIQAALEETLGIPPEDYFRIISCPCATPWFTRRETALSALRRPCNKRSGQNAGVFGLPLHRSGAVAAYGPIATLAACTIMSAIGGLADSSRTIR